LRKILKKLQKDDKEFDDPELKILMQKLLNKLKKRKESDSKIKKLNKNSLHRD